MLHDEFAWMRWNGSPTYWKVSGHDTTLMLGHHKNLFYFYFIFDSALIFRIPFARFRDIRGLQGGVFPIWKVLWRTYRNQWSVLRSLHTHLILKWHNALQHARIITYLFHIQHLKMNMYGFYRLFFFSIWAVSVRDCCQGAQIHLDLLQMFAAR